jgi:RNA polymerase sigma factor (sigma-70 family)
LPECPGASFSAVVVGGGFTGLELVTELAGSPTRAAAAAGRERGPVTLCTQPDRAAAFAAREAEFEVSMTDRSSVAEPEQLAAAFERHRNHLQRVAYAMLGSVTEAEDVVQEAWLRLARTPPDSIRDLRAWLTTTVSRLALDALGTARARREQYVGPWLPEPLVMRGDPVAAAGADLAADPADRVTLDESISMALLIVLERLSPAERTAFLLHDVFGFGFDQVGEVTGRSARRRASWRRGPVRMLRLAARATRRRGSSTRRSPQLSRPPVPKAIWTY